METTALFSVAQFRGVAFGLKDGFSLIQNAGLENINQVRAFGGGIKSRLWRQILASILEVELVTVNTSEGAAYGAALLAGVGVGNWNSVDDACKAAIEITGREKPDFGQVDQYRKGYEDYKELYPTLKDTFRRIGGG